MKTCPGKRKRAEVFNMGDVQWLTVPANRNGPHPQTSARGKDARQKSAEEPFLISLHFSQFLIVGHATRDEK